MNEQHRFDGQNENEAYQAAAQRIAAAGLARSDREMNALLARVDARIEAQAIPHLAETLGAASISADVISELALFFGPRAADKLSDLVDRGVLGYDEENAYVLVPMG